MLVRRKSILTGITRTMALPCTAEQMAAWRAGVLIQDAFPNLDADEREFIKNGITPEEWNHFSIYEEA